MLEDQHRHDFVAAAAEHRRGDVRAEAECKNEKAPASMPGSVRGKVTRQNAPNGVAPRSRAASSSVLFTFSRTAATVNTMNGIMMYTRPMMTAISE